MAAVRYSGDCEVRIRPYRLGFVAMVRAPGFSKACYIDAERKLRTSDVAFKSKTYDLVALAALLRCLREAPLPVDRKRGKVIVERLFKAPCPLER